MGEPLVYLKNRGQLSFHIEKGLKGLIRAMCKFIEELIQGFTASERRKEE